MMLRGRLSCSCMPWDVVGGYSVNRDVIPKGEMNGIDDLLDPNTEAKSSCTTSAPAHGSLSLTDSSSSPRARTS